MQQASTPAGTPDPEEAEAIEGNQHRSLPFSLEGGELQAESGVLHRNGSMTAHEETNESKDTQKDDWHASRIICLHPVPSQPVTGGRNNGEQQRDDIGLQEFSMACGTSRNGDALRYGMLFGLTVTKVTPKNVKTG